MQTIEILRALGVIQWLFGIIATLLVGIGSIVWYFLKKIHNTIIEDHETVTKDHEIIQKIEPMVYNHEKRINKLTTEHRMLHPEISGK